MSDTATKSALDPLIKAVVNRDGSGSADTMLINAHLSQMKMFGINTDLLFFQLPID